VLLDNSAGIPQELRATVAALGVRYRRVTARGFAQVRNAAMDAAHRFDALVFIDDDELPGHTPRIVIVQPYIPSYRTEFFDRLRHRLDAAGCTLDVMHGPPPPSHAARQDAARCAGAIQVPVRRLDVSGGCSLVWHRVRRRVASADVVVLEQALRNVETYQLIIRQRWARTTGAVAPRIALWGHGRTYTKPVSRLERAAKDALTRQAS
jgi:hypothetical protein